MKYIIALLLLPSLAFGGQHEDKSAAVAAKINACAAKSKAAAVAINQKKSWIISESPKTTKTTVTASWNTRAPVGHTHTCTNGHTWDHKLSASHNCPYCGQFVNVQDRSPRPVTVKTASSVQETAPVEMFTMPARVGSAGNCANGQCQNPSMRFFR